MFQPAIPFDGLVGWRMLQQTYDTQFEAFKKSPLQQRDTDYFRENIANIDTAEELVSDRRLLTVALGAFGLQDDINNRYFIQKILEEGTTNDDALANRFADNRYRDLSEAFGFGPGEIQMNRLSFFSEEIIASFERQSFEVAVGEKSQTLRIALAAERSFADLAESDASEGVKWFEVMGQPPLRSLFETVFQLPSGFGQIDIDQQRDVLRDRTMSMFGTTDPSSFADPDMQEELLTKYTALSQVQAYNASATGAAVALALLQSF